MSGQIGPQDAGQIGGATDGRGNSFRGNRPLVPAQPGAFDGWFAQIGRRSQMVSARDESRAESERSRGLWSGCAARRVVSRPRGLPMGQLSSGSVQSPGETSSDRHVSSRKPAAPAERPYTRNEQRLDLAIHILGILFAVNASLWLLWRGGGACGAPPWS